MTQLTVLKKDEGQSSEMLAEYLEPLRAFLDDTSLNEICINRPGEVWTEGSNGWQRFDVPSLTFTHCRQLATLIASYNGKSIVSDKPVLSAALPNGERVQVVIPPACEPRTVSITIRKPSMVDKTLDELEAEGAFDQVDDVDASGTLHPYEIELLALKESKRIKEFLQLAMEHGLTLVIVGKTGSGKTTIGKSITNCIPTNERLVTVEDVHEMFLNHHPNKVHLFYSRDDEGGSKVNPKQAIASCLRMKPDRILLAEMRGDEAWEFVKAVGSGHPGISTAHAGGALEAFDQIVALIKDSPTGAHLDAAYIKKRVFETVDIVLYYVHRKLREVYYDPKFKRKQLG
ncbi:P-type DNA transfer ATPase VirB11 [Neisseriaceae bacterium TC5R-5]|nr:P-type DNA transfer ATPase VirB11 [Neisseriaceae bacterium TC5R-5]